NGCLKVLPRFRQNNWVLSIRVSRCFSGIFSNFFFSASCRRPILDEITRTFRSLPLRSFFEAVRSGPRYGWPMVARNDLAVRGDSCAPITHRKSHVLGSGRSFPIVGSCQ